jgi:hypothetical protein
MARYPIMVVVDERTTGYISEAKLEEFLTERYKDSKLADFEIKVCRVFSGVSLAKHRSGGAKEMGILRSQRQTYGGRYKQRLPKYTRLMLEG